MQRAYSHWRALNDLLQKVMVDMPSQQTVEVLDEVSEGMLHRETKPYVFPAPVCGRKFLESRLPCNVRGNVTFYPPVDESVHPPNAGFRRRGNSPSSVEASRYPLSTRVVEICRTSPLSITMIVTIINM